LYELFYFLIQHKIIKTQARLANNTLWQYFEVQENIYQIECP
jgi:hypothetical protein